MPPEHLTTDIYLSAFLCHKGATLQGLTRLGQKRVEFRFLANAELHALIRLYWSGHLTPVVPWELLQCLRRLKNASINKYE